MPNAGKQAFTLIGFGPCDFMLQKYKKNAKRAIDS